MLRESDTDNADDGFDETVLVGDDTRLIQDVTVALANDTLIPGSDATVIIEESTILISPLSRVASLDDVSEVSRAAPTRESFILESAAQIRAPSGELFSLHRPIVLGRTPRTPLGPYDRVLLLTWPGDDREVSATHVMLEQAGTRVVITDLGSANGTRVRVPGQHQRRLAPHETFTASGEATVEFGHSGRIMVIPARSAPSA